MSHTIFLRLFLFFQIFHFKLIISIHSRLGANDLKVAVGIYSLDRTGIQVPQIVSLERDTFISKDGVAILFLRDAIIPNPGFREAICYWKKWEETSPLDDCVVTGYGRDGNSLHWFDVSVSGNNAKIDGPTRFPSNACDYIEPGNGVACRQLKKRNHPDTDDEYDYLGSVTECSNNVVKFNFLDYEEFLRVVGNRQDRYARQ